MRSILCLQFGMICAVAFASNRPSDVFRADSTMVVVNVSVVDSHDRPVTGLDRRLFHVFQNGREQPIVSFTHEDAPVSIGLIFDASGSMGGKLDRAREMVARLCEDLNEHDEMFLVVVRKSPTLALDYTSSCEDVRSALAFTGADGYTALLDAVPMAVQHLRSAHNPRRAILMISDGGENASRTSPADIRRLAREAAVPIYTAALVGPSGYTEWFPEVGRGEGLLQEIVEGSGGRYLAIDDVRRVKDAADRMATEIHEQYVLGFRAPEAARDGKYQRIAVKVTREGSPRLTVFHRGGYYAPSEP